MLSDSAAARPATVLVVDDQANARDLLCAELVALGFEVVPAADGEEAWRRFCHQTPDVVITDMAMPRCDGLELLQRIRSRSDVPVIVFSGNGSIESAATAFKAGADDFVDALTCEIDDLVNLVRNATESTHAISHPEDLECRLVGDSAAMQRIRWQVAGLAPLSTPVLVSGESGTGLSTTIRALHELGVSGGSELRRIQAASFSLETAPQLAGGPGAVYLADVERLSPAGQEFWADQLAKARGQTLRSRTRVFASTSAPLSSLVRGGRFHPDLGRALLRFHIELPPLRDRSGDVPAIAKALLARIGTAMGRDRVKLSPAALAYLETSRFPENIRQLERLLERATAYSIGRVIRRRTLQDLMVDLEDSVASMREERRFLERERLVRTLQETGGNITHTADILERSRAAVYRMIDKYDIPLKRAD